jgi:hypothetical protein
MLIVPLKGDKLTTTDGPEFTVDSYTNFKTDPAVYVDVPRGQNPIVYFQDIEQINGVKVEYNKATKVFTALGIVKRKYNLPQPKDTITVKKPGNPDDSQDDQAQIKTSKLHSRSIGLSKGLVLIDTEDNVYSLSGVLGIDRAVGSEHFDRKRFLKYYRDYLGHGAA